SMWSAVVFTVTVAYPLAKSKVAVATDRPSAVCKWAVSVCPPGAALVEPAVDDCWCELQLTAMTDVAARITVNLNMSRD
ncbi:MAG: hypothetical protein WB777_08725, partial [Mycobacterium sp.]